MRIGRLLWGCVWLGLWVMVGHAAPVLPEAQTNVAVAASNDAGLSWASMEAAAEGFPEDGAEALGLSPRDADVLPGLKQGLAEVVMEEDAALYKRPRQEGNTALPDRQPWRPRVSFETLFYMGLAGMLALALLLRARVSGAFAPEATSRGSERAPSANDDHRQGI